MAMVNDADSLKWGYLVKSWATGLDYVSPTATPHPPQNPPAAPPAWVLPALKPVNFNVTTAGGTVQKTIPGVTHLSTGDFAGLLDKAGIHTVNYPPGTTDVIVVQGSATTMVIRLPPTSVLQASEQNLLHGGGYPVFSFYSPLYSPIGGPVIAPHPPQMPDQKGVMDLHANRIGDYTMGLCA
jgi:hypothetical protein